MAEPKSTSDANDADLDDEQSVSCVRLGFIEPVQKELDIRDFPSKVGGKPVISKASQFEKLHSFILFVHI